MFFVIRNVQEMETAKTKSRCRERESTQSTSYFDTEPQSSHSTRMESCEPRTTDYLTHGGQEREKRNGKVCCHVLLVSRIQISRKSMQGKFREIEGKIAVFD